jgi:hypothetical protein
MSSVRFGRPAIDDRKKLIEFLAENWREDHLFVRDPAWFDWQHLARDGRSYHAIVALGEGDRIDGFLGIMPLAENPASVATGIWVARKQSANRRVGLELFAALERIYRPRYIGSLGVNEPARKILQMLGHRAGTSSQFYLSNPDAPALLAEGLARSDAPADAASGLREIGDLEDLALPASGSLPGKPLAWYRWRYQSGAPYAYRFFLAEVHGRARLLLVARRVEAAGGACLRIVDLLGDLAGAGRFAPRFLPILAAENLEYVDLVVGGPDLSAFSSAGFVAREDPAVLPNHFDPFLRKNVALGWTLKAAGSPCYVLRGDGDQDRPNRVGPPAPDWSSRPF